MSDDPFTPPELTAAAEELDRQNANDDDRSVAAYVLRAVAPLIAARVREQVAEGIAAAIEATARTSYQTRGPAYRDAASIARAHRATPGDDHA